MPDDRAIKFKEKIAELEQKVAEIREMSIFKEIPQMLGDLSKKIEGIAGKEYGYMGVLRTPFNAIRKQWADGEAELKAQLEMAVKKLVGSLDHAKLLFNHAKIDELEKYMREVEDNLRGVDGIISKFKSPLDSARYQIESFVRGVEDALKEAGEASFGFEPDEKVYYANDAEWVKSENKDDKPDGILYLTNKRLIFEQKEKVGKRFGFFGGKEVQGLGFTVAIVDVVSIETDNEGFFGRKDMLTVRCGGSSTYALLTLEVKGGGDNKTWQEMLEKAKVGKLGET